MKKQIILVLITTTLLMQNGFAQNKGNLSFNDVMTSYINLKNALTIDNSDSAKVCAKLLFNTIDKMPMQTLTTDKHIIWMKYTKKLSDEAEQISKTNDIKIQRYHFMPLSKYMYIVAKEFKTNTNNLNYQFCPMADNGKGAYWISETEAIHNPYFGKKMATCGSTKEIIKPLK